MNERKINMKTNLRPEVGIGAKPVWEASRFQVPSFFAPDIKRGLRILLVVGGIGLILFWVSGGFQ